MFALRLVTLDHYLASPSAPLDPLVSKLGGWEVWQVPVVRIFGVTPAGQKACLHVHGAMPYLTVPCAEPRPERFAVVLASEIDLLLNTAAGRATSMHRHVHHVAVIHATRLYGFHDREETFLRIFLYNPLHVAKVAELLLSGLVQKRVMQPHEAHIPFALQFMVDHNLHGMSFVRVESFKFRRTPSWIQDKCSIRGTGLWDLDSLPAELFGNLEKQTTCELELDCCARDILNASDKEGLNPGLAALWQEEEERRQEPVSWLPLSTEDEDFPRTESEQFYLARLDKRLARPTVDEQDRSGTRESRRKHHSHILDTSHGVLDSQDEALAEALAQAASGWSQGEPCEEDSILGSLPCPDGDEADEDEDNAEDMSQVFQLVGDREQDDDGVSSMSDQSDGNEAYDPFQLDGADDTPESSADEAAACDASARGSSTRDQGTQTGARPPVLVRRLLGRARTRRCTRLSLRRQQQQQRQATQECQQPERLPGSTSARLVGRLPDEVGASPPVAEDWQRWQSCHVASLLMSPESYSTPSTLTASSPAPEPSPSYAPVDTERSRESEAVLPCSVKLLRLTEDEVNRWQRRPPPAEVHHKRRSWHEPECHGGGRNRIVLEEDVPKPRKRRKKRGCSASSSTSSMVLRSSPPAEEVDLRVPASSSTSEGITTEADHRAPLWGAATTVCGEVVPGGSVNSGTQGVRKRLEAGGDKTGSGTNKSRLQLQSVDQGEGTSSLELPPGTSSAMNSVADHGASPRQEQSCAERKVSSKPDCFVEARRPVSVASTSSSPASSLSSSQDVNGLGELKASECRPSVICRIRIRGKRMISTTTTRLVPIVVGLENDQGFNTPATSSSSCEAAEIPSSTAVTGTSTLAPQNSEAGGESALLHPVQNYKPSFSKGKSSRRLAKSKLSASTVPDASMDASISDLVSRFSRCEVVMAASSEGSEAEVTSDITKCDLSKATNVTASSEASVDKEGLIAKPVYSELTDSVTPVISAVTDDGNMLVQPFSNVTGEVGSFGGGLPSSGSPRVKGGHKRDGPRRSATAVYLGGDDRGERKDSSPVEERNMTQSAGRRTRWRAAKLSSSKLGLRRSSRLEAVVSPSSCEVSDLERSDSGLHKRISPSKGVKLSTHLSRHQIAVEEAETPRIVFRPRCAKGTDFASAQVNHLGIEETVIPERSVCASVLTEKDTGVIVESKEPQVVPSGKPSCVNILDEKESSPNRTANCKSEGKDKAKISASKLALNKVEASNATPSVSMTAITERDSVGAAGKMPAVHSGSFKTHGSSALIVSHAINAKNTSICGPNDTEVTITHEPLKLRASKSSRALKKQVESPPVPSRRLRTRSALRDACEAGVQKADVSYEKLELTRPPVPSGDGELLTSSSIDEVAGSQEPLSSSLETFTKEISRNQGRPRKVKTKNSVDIGKERTAKLVSEGLLPDGANADALLGSGSDTQLAGSPILSEVHSHSAGSQELLSGDTFRKVCLRKRGRPSKVKDKCSTGTNKERTKVTSEALVPDGTSGDALRNSGSDIQWSSSPILTEAHSQPAGSQVLPNDSLDTFRKESPRKRGRPRKVEDKCSPDTGKERKTKVVSEGLVPDGVNVDALLSAGSDSQWMDSRTLTNVHSQPDAAACVDDREGKSLERRQTRRRKANIAAPDAVKRGSQVSELMASEGMVIGASLNSSCADVRHQRTPEQRAAVGASSPTQGSCLVREKNTELATKLVVAELGGKGSPMSRSPLSSGSKDKQEARSPVLCKSPDISTSSAGDHSVGGLSSGFTDAVSKHCTAVLPIPGKHSVKHIDQGTDDLTLTEPSPHERSVSSIEKGRDVFQNSKLAPTSSAEATSTACRKQQPELAEELFQLEAALSRANLADDAEVVTAENAGTEEASATPANNSLCLGSDDEENWILLDEAGDDSVELFSSSDEMAEPASREGCKDGVGSDEDIGDKGKDDGSRDNLVSCDSSEDTSGAQDSSRTCLEDVCEKNCVDINGEGSPVETGHGAEVGSETCAVGTSAEVTLAVGNEQFGEISCGDVGENFGSGSSICNISCETGGEFIASENFTEDVDLGESEELFGQVTSTPKGEEDGDSTFTGKPLQVIITRLDDVDVHSHLGQLYVKAKQAMKPCCERSAGCSDAQASDHVRNRRLYHSEARQTGAADQDCAKRSARRSDQKHARRKLGSEELHVADEDVAVSLSAKKPGKQRERRLGVLEAQETDKVDQESSKLPSSTNSDQQHSRRRLNTEVLEVTAVQQAGADASSARQPEKLCKGRFGEAEETGLVDQDATKFSSSRKSDKQNTEVLEATAVQQAGADASSPRQPEKLSKGRFDEAEETGLVDQDVTKFSSSRKSDQQHMKRRLDSEDLERAMMGEESADPSSTSKSEKQLSEKSLYSEPQQAGILDHDSAKSSTEKLLLPQPDIAKVPGLLDQVLDNYELPDALKCLLDAEMPFPELDADCFNLPHDPARWLPDDGTVEKPKFDERPPLKEDPPFCPSDESMLGDLAKACSLTTEGLVVLVPAVPPPSFNAPQLSSSYTKRARDRPKGLAFWQKAKLEAFARDSCFEVDFDHNPELRIAFCRDRTVVLTPARCPPTAALLASLCRRPPSPEDDGVSTYEPLHDEASSEPVTPVATPPRHETSTSQLDGPTGRFALSGARLPTDMERVLTVLSVEVHVRTRGDLCPDPGQDAIHCVIWCARGHGEEAPVEAGAMHWALCDPRLPDVEDLVSMSLRRTGVAGPTLRTQVVRSERDLLLAFVDLVHRWDPDVLLGYDAERASWGYLCERAERLELDLYARLSRAPPPPGRKEFVGRILLSVWRILRKEITLNIYTFENAYYHVMHRRVPLYSFRTLSEWFSQDLFRWRVVEHYVLRARGNLELLDELNVFGKTSQMASVYGIQFLEVLSRGSQFRVESMLLRLVRSRRMVALSPSTAQRAKQRAPEFIPLVLEPRAQLYTDPVVVLDFQSLYPSVIIAHNYCFSTCLGRIESLGSASPFGCSTLEVPLTFARSLRDHITVSPAGVAFVRPSIRKGLLPQMLDEVLGTRLMVKKAMSLCTDQALRRVLDAQQLSLKLIANVTYGYTAASFSGRMPCVEVADSVVSKGREALERAIRTAEATVPGARVIYGDTDSLFVLLEGRSRREAFQLGQEIADRVTAQNPRPMCLRMEKVYQPCVLQTKKRYVGFAYEHPDQQEPKYDAKGIETVRRDTCPAVAKLLEKMLRVLFTTQDVNAVKRFVKLQFSKILSERVSPQDFIFAREFRGLHGYQPSACVPALEIARRLVRRDPRAEPLVGERVPYVVVYGHPGQRLIELVRQPHELLGSHSQLRLNAHYYVARAIGPALNRVLRLLGANCLQWYEELPRPRFVNPRPGTVAAYLVVGQLCLACGGQSESRQLCTSCEADPAYTALVLGGKVQRVQKSLLELQTVCHSCMGFQASGACVSTDCPVLYKTARVTAEAQQALVWNSARSASSSSS